MKKYHRVILLGALILSLALQSCKDYFDQNVNPNQVSNPSLPSMLSTSTMKAGLNSYNVGNLVSNYVQYTANPIAAAASDTYQIVDYTSTWDALYFALADAKDLKTVALAQGSSEYIGVANVLLAYNLSLVSDLWGAAPYSDAFNPATLTPKYDSEEQNYNSVNMLLDEAISELTKTTATIKLAAASDLIHGGDRAKWLKTAYALKARHLIKISKKSTFNAANVLTALSNSYTSNADDAGMASFVLRNNWATVAINNASLTLGGWLSEQLIDHLNGTTYGILDPRIRKITDPTSVPLNPAYPAYIGTVNGAGNRNNPPNNNTVKDENYISANSPWTSATSPLLLVTYAELKFIEAEAALATDPTRAYNAYIAGIGANMDKLQVPTIEKNAYLASPIVAVGIGNLTKTLIFKEKYIATYLNSEAWNDARRSDYQYKDFSLPLNAALPSFIRRVAYPSGETTKNGANVPVEVPLNTNLWWDKP
ncbi:Starch-binding associating with outer membrane [compost metagenome]